MTEAPPNQITTLLREIEHDTPGAVEQLIDLVYHDLKRIAAARLRSMPPWEAMQPTSLVNEAYLRLFDRENITWANRRHFFSAASMVMRDVMADRARAALSDKRGGNRTQQPLDEDVLLVEESTRFLELNDMIEKLAERFPRQSRVVEFRLIVGLTDDQIGLALDIAPATVRRDWKLARAWLRSRLHANNGETA